MTGGTRGDRMRGGRRRRVRAILPAGLEQVRALAHPLRLRLLELFAERARTTKQAAEALGEAPTRLYHHVAALERAGLVRLRETRRVRGAVAKYFELAPAAPRAVPMRPARTRAGRRDATALGVLLFEEARRDLVRALAERRPEELQHLLALRGVLRLTAAEHGRLRRALLRLLRGVRERPAGTRRSRRRRYSLTIALLPADGAGGPAGGRGR